MRKILSVRQGEVQGTLSDGVYAFKGIPYAAPPYGAFRFLPPQPREPWDGVLQANDYRPKPPQVPYPEPLDAIFSDVGVAGEDCLNLNIWAPDRESGGRPVMVWITGGEFEHVANADCDGSRFARDGVVCVSINYRVGADGFMYLGDGTANCGLLDQVAALRWLQQNITAFGGDPGNVTVFGQSAGAISIAMLLAMPDARGLFRRAICQSGGAHPTLFPAAAQRVGRRLADLLGVSATRAAIAGVPIERTLQAQIALSAELAGNPDPERWGKGVAVSMMPWQPVIDGEVIPAPPLDLIAAGAAANIDLMVGTNSDEWRLFLVPSGVLSQITDAMLSGAVAAYGLPVETLARYRARLAHASAGELLAGIQGDWYFRIPAMRLADAHAGAATTASTFAYEFAWKSPEYDGRLGACHGLEIPFVFDTLGSGTGRLVGANPPQTLADAMHAAWVAFATTGNSGWPEYDPAGRATMRFDRRSAMVQSTPPPERALCEA